MIGYIQVTDTERRRVAVAVSDVKAVREGGPTSATRIVAIDGSFYSVRESYDDVCVMIAEANQNMLYVIDGSWKLAITDVVARFWNSPFGVPAGPPPPGSVAAAAGRFTTGG